MITPQAPIRTCVGCRRRDTQAVLLRVTSQHGQLTVDGPKRAPGRGAYVHRTRTCIDRALVGGRVARALRAPLVSHEISDIWQYVDRE